MIVAKFNSVGELSKRLANATPTNTFKNASKTGSYSTTDSYKKWSKTATYEEADELLLYGDKSLQAKIENAGVRDMRLKLSMNGQRRQLYSSVVGFAPNVPAYVAGTPNSMINVRTVKTKQRVISVLYNTSVSARVSADEIIRVAAKMISAIMLIESNGVRVNLYSGNLSQEFGSSVGNAFVSIYRIKDSGQQIDTLKMAYPLAHPSMLRRHGFRVLETTEGVPSTFTSAYGYPLKDESKALELLKMAGEKNIDVVLCYYDISKCETPQEVAELIMNYNK